MSACLGWDVAFHIDLYRSNQTTMGFVPFFMPLKLLSRLKKSMMMPPFGVFINDRGPACARDIETCHSALLEPLHTDRLIGPRPYLTINIAKGYVPWLRS